MIDSNRIIVESPSGPNINQNPLRRHTETNMLEMMKGHEEFASLYKPILRVGTGIEKSANVVDLTKMMPLGAESVLEKLSPSNTPILTVKRALKDVWASPSKAKPFVSKIKDVECFESYREKDVESSLEKFGLFSTLRILF